MTRTNRTPVCRMQQLARGLGCSRLLALALAPIGATCGLLGCSAAPQADEETARNESALTQSAVTDSCGFAVTSLYHSRWKHDGFYGLLELKNVSGDKATDFEIFADLHGASPSKCLLADCAPAEGGYVFTPPNWFHLVGLRRGQTYPIPYLSKDAYQEVTPYVISINGKVCDQVAPAVSLEQSESLYTADGTLTLSAVASDNVAVKKIVFLRDGQAIGTDTTAPYTLDVPVSATANGRHRYSAVAYDMSGNSATSGQKSVLTAIGNKFLGMAATTAADYPDLLSYFNQVTPGNAGKWGTVEATRDQMNFTDLDTAYNFAKANGIPFKLHTLVWGQQQPAWLSGLTAAEQLVEIEQWMTALAERYPNVDLIDVVNEPLHAPPSYIDALGGAGTTGWDWVIKSFEMARAHFPNAELLLNDYSVLSLAGSTQNYLQIVKLLQDRGLIDGIGEQGHFYERTDLSTISTNLASLAATGLPIYISELDVNFADDARQAQRISQLFPIFWSNPSVLGVTYWGYKQGSMWQTDAYLLRTDGTARPALTWMECYRAGGTNCTVPEYVPSPRKGDTIGITLEAEDYDSAQGLLAAGTMVAYTSDGSWLGFERVVFDSNWDTLSVTYAQGGTNNVNLTIHAGSLANAPIATVTLPPTGGWSATKTVSIPWAPMSGEQNLFARFNGGGANLDKIKFSAPTGYGANLVTNGDFESGTAVDWWTWGTGTIDYTTARAASGSRSIGMTGRAAGAPLVKTLTSVVAPGKTYHVSLWATIGATAASDTVYVTTITQCAGQDASYGQLGGWTDGKKVVTDGTWVEFGGDLVVPDCSLANVAIALVDPTTADVYVDHVSVRAQSTTNIVQNGTFESGASGWFSWGGATVAATAARHHGGSQSLQVSNRTSNLPAAIDLTSAVKAGASYPFSLWVSIDSLGTADGTSQTINLTRATTVSGSTSYSWIGGPVTVADDGSWVQITGTLTVPDTFDKLQLFVEGGAGADLFVDDVQILDNIGGVVNLIPDGTFESGIGAWGGWNLGGYAVVNTAAHAGQQCLMGTSMEQYGALARDIKALVAAGKRYQATAWVSVGNLTAGSGSVKFQTVQSCNGTGSDSYPWLAGATVNSGTWQQITGTVDLSACTSLEKLQLFVGADSGDLYVDDVTLIALP
jgi:endo-1,4-beta-xylanase